ncbi:Rpa49 subunit specific to nuclear RNA polymerase I [Gautieria morchelliformis]|nr:Rpa49 subunit specific to nuclear RNA polymerase I [Gautieria morchelliformis]
MTDSTHTKKRKRDTYEEDDRITLSTSTACSAVGPMVVAFPALQPTQSTAFKCYVKDRKASTDDSTIQDFTSSGVVIAGETESVEFHTGIDQQPNAPSCQYMIGVHDKTTHKVTLRHAPFHVLTRDVKALRSLDPIATGSQERLQARNLLGEAFGSKKAKQAIRAMERNRVDVSAMEGVANHLQDSIEAATWNLPSREAAKVAADENRPIPRYNVHAKSSDEVYALHDIVSETELNSVPLGRLMSAPEDQRIAWLPYTRSAWINQHLSNEFNERKPKMSNLKILFYISSMFLFRKAPVGDKARLQKRMSSVPNEIIEGLLAKFAERSRNSTESQVTTQGQTLLLTYMFALFLRLDQYASEPTRIAADLSMSVPNTVTHFKHLGCKHEFLTSADRTRLGIGPATDKELKWCILRVPFDFPRQRFPKRK